MPTLRLTSLRIRDVRNLHAVDLAPASRVNVITGNNGHGKTSLLEAIYFAATSRSFRTPRARELVKHGASAASVRARFEEIGDDGSPPLVREQSAGLEGKRSVVKLDGKAPPSLAEFATHSPVVAFHPDELALSSGPAAGRRTLLDRLSLFLDPTSADHRARYAHALKARHQLLRRAVDLDAPLGDVEAFEELCAVHGAALTRARERAVRALTPELASAFAQIAAPDLVLGVRYAPGGSPSPDDARAELRNDRRRDSHRASAAFGPHRDDLELSLGGHPVRLVASQGQHRALTLALKAAETASIAAARGLEPILLLDDVSSELDPDRTTALFTFLGLARGQVFLTTTRRELIVTPELGPEARRDFQVVDGAVVGLA